MVELPCARPDARPSEPPAFETLATPVADDVHVTWVVRFCVEPSVYVPVAENCTVVPFAIDGVLGVTPIDTSVAAVTVTVVEALTAPSAALTSVVPVAAAET